MYLIRWFSHCDTSSDFRLLWHCRNKLLSQCLRWPLFSEKLSSTDRCPLSKHAGLVLTHETLSQTILDQNPSSKLLRDRQSIVGMALPGNIPENTRAFLNHLMPHQHPQHLLWKLSLIPLVYNRTTSSILRLEICLNPRYDWIPFSILIVAVSNEYTYREDGRMCWSRLLSELRDGLSFSNI
jgi:hypothetical protein